MPNSRSHNKIAVRLLGITLFMLAASFAAVPLYDIFCRVTGFGGTTQVADENKSDVLDREMIVRFAGSTMSDMPWEFNPMTSRVDARLGETTLVFFEAYNPTKDVVTGTASFNVAPLELGGYFSKIECFCFTEQTLQPGERVEMPVTFYVDPAMVDDPDVEHIQSLTLAYTFHLTSRVPVGTSENNS